MSDLGAGHLPPYAIVPFQGACRREPVKQAGHERFMGFSGRLHYRIEVLTPFLVARDTSAKTVVFLEVQGRPVVPGSTIKGMLRATVEALASGCVGAHPRGRRREQLGEFAACIEVERACPSCRMFGLATERGSYQGRVYCADAFAEPPLKEATFTVQQLYGPNEGHGPYRDGDRYRGRKFYRHGRPVDVEAARREYGTRPRTMELRCAAEGSRFTGFVQVENLRPAELDLLIFALALPFPSASGERYAHKMGYAKPLGFGSVLVELTGVEPAPFSQTNPVDATIGSFLAGAAERVLADRSTQAEALRPVLSFPEPLPTYYYPTPNRR